MNFKLSKKAKTLIVSSVIGVTAFSSTVQVNANTIKNSARPNTICSNGSCGSNGKSKSNCNLNFGSNCNSFLNGFNCNAGNNNTNCNTGNCGSSNNCAGGNCDNGSCDISNGNCNTGNCNVVDNNDWKNGFCSIVDIFNGQDDSSDNTVDNNDAQENNDTDKNDTNDNNANNNDANSNDANDNSNAGTGEFADLQKQVLDIVNAERAKSGLKALTLDAKLSEVATLKSQDMINKNYFDHNSPTYGSPFDMMKKYGITYQTAGENIAMGQKSPQEVMTAWMNSEGHRKNILTSNFTKIGVGVAKNANGTIYWTQMFVG
ncbi:MAG: CAP domain-containing protein [Clostridioides sp.]|nr:CAP domain-containing protein [Clostridioides sp.]